MSTKLPHPVPARAGQVVEIRDGNHEGTTVVRREGDHDEPFLFVSHDRQRVGYAARCLLLQGQDVEAIPPGYPYGCDLDTGADFVLLGLDADEDPRDLEWLTGEVLWRSR